mmetsp:Transcript_47955/g.65003  ORF Transcript_47955/g.65003 Transcript_47955/m.65003 type:complete len:212 (-) Transcript_47955:154-789(-)
MVKHNNIIPNVHLRKHWERRVKTHFNQPAYKKRRAMARAAKAAAAFPRPLQKLRPVVHCPTRKYIGKVRYGRGFTQQELKAAGLSAKFARTVGIAVDTRRTNTSEEALRANAERLNEYKNKLILFPRREGKPKKGEINDSTPEQLKSAAANQQAQGAVMPIAKVAEEVQYEKITAEHEKAKAFHTLRSLRTFRRYKGKREKRAREEEEKKK